MRSPCYRIYCFSNLSANREAISSYVNDLSSGASGDLSTVITALNTLSGDNYNISDIATFPWIARHEWHDIGLSKFKNLTRWYNEISKRDAVVKGFSFMNKNELPPKAQ